MVEKDEDFLKRLLATFKIEAQEHVNAISAGLIELEKSSGAEKQMEVVETVFREAHSLKGAARAVNQTAIETVCQSLESIFAAWKRREAIPSPALFDALHETVDSLEKLLVSLEGRGPAAEPFEISALIHRLESAAEGNVIGERRAGAGDQGGESGRPPGPAPQPVTAEPRTVTPDTVRISIAKLDSLLPQAEELLAAKLTARQRAAELREINARLVEWKKEWAKIRPDVRVIQQSFERNGKRNGQGEKNSHTMKLLDFLERNETHIKAVESRLADLAKSAEHDHRSLGGMVDNLLEDMKKVLMLPFSSLLQLFPKLVRDLSRDRGKEVELVIHGEEIEVDRRVLEGVKDPLIHVIRNCIDHGIEKPEERGRKKKPPRGTVTIAVAQKDGSRVEILVSDDGSGVDVAKVRVAAVKLGVVSQEEAEKMGEEEALSLIFRSGVSTSPMITDLSGRGLGLAVVREKTEKLGGFVALETRGDMGTTIRMVLPLTLATFRGMLVGVEGRLFVIPTTSVERALRVKKEEIQTVENRETIQVDQQAVALVRLGEVLELPGKNPRGDSAEHLQGVVLGSAERRIAFVVDEILNEQEVLVKTLGKQLSRVRNIAGATVLGAGQVVPILNVPDLMKSAVRAQGTAVKPAAVPQETGQATRKSVLVVEDSITARALVKNILEAAGYEVSTAVDGVDGFTQLRSGQFDMVLSDVDMPRMSGFDLTAKIRADKMLSALPVVLVTALESREDRERGIDVGANAYIVKSSFDQSNLLEVIRRLL
jgi:two-component system chemotaxis sensor kinase CheA